MITNLTIEIARWHVHKICNHYKEMEQVGPLVLIPYGPSFFHAVILHVWYNSHCTDLKLYSVVVFSQAGEAALEE